MTQREALEARWFALTREEMPAIARQRGWPVHLDHCFQRILLDNTCGRPWREAIASPAYRNAPEELLRKAIALGEDAIAGKADLAQLNTRSLRLRGKL